MPFLFEAAGAYRKPLDRDDQHPPPYFISSCSERLFATALSIGSETGFDTSYRVGRFVCQQLVNHLCLTKEISNTAIEHAFAHAQEKLAVAFPPNLQEMNVPSSTAICLAISVDWVCIGWLGTEEAYHIRDSKIIAATQGHSAGKLHRDRDVPPDMKDMAVRALDTDPDYNNLPAETLPEPWQLIVGDTLVLATIKLWSNLPSEQMPALVTGKSAQAAADALVNAALMSERQWGVAAVVIQVKDA
jgi:serine/threonine protein phosphatase PrpC